MKNLSAGASETTALVSTRARCARPADHLHISIERAGSETRLCMRGTLDMASAAIVYDEIVAAAAAPTCQLHLDLNDLETATRIACRAIHVAAKMLHWRGGRMTIFAARPNVERILKNTGFDNLVEFRDGKAPLASSTSATPVANQLRGVACPPNAVSSNGRRPE